ncbi:hypothetical protein BC827DRAFT_1172397, partial [Russula dissimulans]
QGNIWLLLAAIAHVPPVIPFSPFRKTQVLIEPDSCQIPGPLNLVRHVIVASVRVIHLFYGFYDPDVPDSRCYHCVDCCNQNVSLPY